MRLLFLRYCYGFYSTLAYLASHRDEPSTVAMHKSTADEFERQYRTELING